MGSANPVEFNGWVTADGSSGFKAEAGRYHLYVAYGCPFAHRAIIARSLKGLEDVISMSCVNWQLNKEKGWPFTDEYPDPLYGAAFLGEIYHKANPRYSGRFTVPVLWDKHKETIVSNSSADILRMLATEFNAFSATPESRSLDLYPKELRGAIDEMNAFVQQSINEGVYACGFATEQAAYEKGYHALFAALDRCEEILGKHRYIHGVRLTETDIRLFTTLLRFDSVYYLHYKCNKKRIADYPNLQRFVCDLAHMPCIRKYINHDYIKKMYYSDRARNPSGIIPLGPDLAY